MMSKYIQVGNSNGEFEIQLSSYIGGGTYGSIYNCHQVSYPPNVQAIRKELCAKILKVDPKISKDKNKIQQEREHQINKILKENENNKNQNIVQVFYVNLNQQKSELIIVMEKCQTNLEQYWQNNPQKRKFNQFQIIQFVQQFINGYQILYDNQIVHRNIKPNNILINIENGQNCYKIADFGLGKIYKNNEILTTTLTMSGYSAPEILDIEFDLSKSYSDLSKEKKHVVDMFSLGMILYQLATGSLPFKVNEEKAFFEQLKRQPIKIENTQLNQQQNKLIEQMLIYNPKQRLSFDQLQNSSIFIFTFQNSVIGFPNNRFNGQAFNGQFKNIEQSFIKSQNGMQFQSQFIIQKFQKPNEQINQLNLEVKEYLKHYLQFNQRTIKEEVKQVLVNINFKNQLNSDDIQKICEWFQYEVGYQNSYSEQELVFFYKLKCLRYNQQYQNGLSKFQLIQKLNNQQ